MDTAFYSKGYIHSNLHRGIKLDKPRHIFCATMLPPSKVTPPVKVVYKCCSIFCIIQKPTNQLWLQQLEIRILYQLPKRLQQELSLQLQHLLLSLKYVCRYVYCIMYFICSIIANTSFAVIFAAGQ